MDLRITINPRQTFERDVGISSTSGLQAFGSTTGATLNEVIYGANTLAGAGGLPLPSGATSITNAGGTNLVVSGGYVVPGPLGGVTSGTVTFNNGTIWTVTSVTENGWPTRSVRTTAEGVSAKGNGIVVLFRDGTYTWDEYLHRRTGFGGVGCIFKAENWRQAIVSGTLRNRSGSNVTIDGFKINGGVSLLCESAFSLNNFTLKNCEVSRGSWDPTADWSASPPTGADGIFCTGSSKAPGDIRIENCYIHHCATGAVLYSQGVIRLYGNHFQYNFEDHIKISSTVDGSLMDHVEAYDNYMESVVGNGNDSGNPHPDAFQFTGARSTNTNLFDRNIIFHNIQRAAPQGIHMDDLGSGYHTVEVRGLLLVTFGSVGPVGINVTRAENCKVIGSTLVGFASGGEPPIRLGLQAISGVHEVRNTVAMGFYYNGGVVTGGNNYDAGTSGSPTVPFTSMFDNPLPTYTNADVAYHDLLSRYAVKAGGPLDTTIDIGATSGYVNWPVNAPGQTATYTPGSFNSGFV